MNEPHPRYHRTETLIAILVLLLFLLGIRSFFHRPVQVLPVPVSSSAPRVEVSPVVVSSHGFQVVINGPEKASVGSCFEVKADYLDNVTVKAVLSPGIRLIFSTQSGYPLFIYPDRQCTGPKSSSVPTEISTAQTGNTFYLLSPIQGNLAATATDRQNAVVPVTFFHPINIQDEKRLRLEFSHVPSLVEEKVPFNIEALVKETSSQMVSGYTSPVVLSYRQRGEDNRRFLAKQVPQRGVVLFKNLSLTYANHSDLIFTIESGELKVDSELVSFAPHGGKILYVRFGKELAQMAFHPPNRYEVYGKIYIVNDLKKDRITVLGKRYRLSQVSPDTYQLDLDSE